MNLPADLVATVRARAGGRCEYCRMSQSLQGASFHIEHIRPLAKAGVTTAGNLALACPSCNLHKSDRLIAPDPESGQVVPLYHPRTHSWAAHFAWRRTTLIGLTPAGRATVAALDLNHSRRLRVREAEVKFGLFPPPLPS
jgi:hypothetical protein